MTQAHKRPNLGRGLAALLGDDGDQFRDIAKSKAPHTLPIDRLQPGKYQPRQHVDAAHIEELANSIREKGVLQPLLVRKVTGPADQPDQYEIIAGERRWRAAQMANLHDVPVVIRDFSDVEALEIGLIENLQRQDLTALEEAEGYQRLLDEFGHTQEELSKGVGKSRSHVANTLRLLGLPDAIKKMLEDNLLSAGHARALLSAPDPVTLAKQAVDQGLNVRQVEKLAKKAPLESKPVKTIIKDSNTIALERELVETLGLKVSIKFDGQKGSLIINYDDLDQLDDVIARLKGPNVAVGNF